MKESDRKKYLKPAMWVYPLKKQPQLLIGSTRSSGDPNYTPFNDEKDW